MTKDVVLTWLVCLSVVGFLVCAGISSNHSSPGDDDSFFGTTAYRPSR